MRELSALRPARLKAPRTTSWTQASAAINHLEGELFAYKLSHQVATGIRRLFLPLCGAHFKRAFAAMPQAEEVKFDSCAELVEERDQV